MPNQTDYKPTNIRQNADAILDSLAGHLNMSKVSTLTLLICGSVMLSSEQLKAVIEQGRVVEAFIIAGVEFKYPEITNAPDNLRVLITNSMENLQRQLNDVTGEET